MGRKKSEFLSGFGVANEILRAIVNAVLDQGGDDEDLRRIIREPDLASELAKLIVRKKEVSAKEVSAKVFKVVVDYSMSLAEMISAGRYNWTNSDINAESFPVSGEGKKEVELELVHLNRDAGTEEVLEELDRQGLRPAKIEELLALGAKHPELQKQFPIIAFGSVWRRPSGYRLVPFLDWGGLERLLRLYFYDRRWGGVCRFAAVRK
jgi:hypothetical protein